MSEEKNSFKIIINGHPKNIVGHQTLTQTKDAKTFSRIKFDLEDQLTNKKQTLAFEFTTYDEESETVGLDKLFKKLNDFKPSVKSAFDGLDSLFGEVTGTRKSSETGKPETFKTDIEDLGGIAELYATKLAKTALKAVEEAMSKSDPKKE